MFISSVISPAVLLPETENPVTAFLEYPEEAVVTLESAGLTAEELMYRASAEHAEYVQSGGYDDIGGIFVSPYYTYCTYRQYGYPCVFNNGFSACRGFRSTSLTLGLFCDVTLE